MGILGYIKRKFEEHREHQQRGRELRAKANREFPAFLEGSVSLTRRDLRDHATDVFRTAWKRAVVLKSIYEQRGLAEDAAIHEIFQELAIKGFRASLENTERRATLQLSPTERSRLSTIELGRLFPRPARQPAQEEAQKEEPQKATSCHRKRRSKSDSRKTGAYTINAYEPRNDGTAIDAFVRGLKEYLANDRIAFRVSGLASPPRRHKTLEPWIAVCPPSREPNGDSRWAKAYKVGMLLPADCWNLRELVEKARIDPYSTVDYYDTHLKPIADEIQRHVQGYVSRYDGSFHVSAGIKSNGKISAWVHVNLRITAYDAVVHCGTSLTDYPRRFLDELAQEVDEELAEKPELMMSIYGDTGFRYTFFRKAEEELRRKHNVPSIGEGHVSEMSLHRLIKKRCPDARHEHSPSWLGNQRFDIYIPSLRVAIEYNGPQHYEPIELFGGEEGFMEIKKRDERKRQLALENGVTVYEWSYTKPINEEEVTRLLDGLQSATTSRLAPS